MTDHPLAALLRPVRAGVFAAASLGLAVAAHVIGGGAAPGPAVLAVVGAALWLLAGAAAGKERGGRFVGAAVLGMQVLLHGVFTTVRRPPLTAPNASLVDLLLCHHGGVNPAQAAAAQRMLGLPDGPEAAGAAASAGVLSSPWSMLAAHLVAAGLMAWWLRRGERAAWAAMRRAAGSLAALLPAMCSPGPIPTLPLPGATRPVDRVSASVRELLRNTARGLRGPPSHRPCALSRSLTRWSQPVRA